MRFFKKRKPGLSNQRWNQVHHVDLLDFPVELSHRAASEGNRTAPEGNRPLLGAHQQENQVNQPDVLDFRVDLGTWTQLNKEIK
jgi:hypothetical protein